MAVGTNCLQGSEGTNQAVNGGRSCGLSGAFSHKPVEAEAVLQMHHSVPTLFVCHPKGGCGLSPLQAGPCM